MKHKLCNFSLKAIEFKVESKMAVNTTNEVETSEEQSIEDSDEEASEESNGKERNEDTNAETNGAGAVRRHREWLEENIVLNSRLLDKLRDNRTLSRREMFLVKHNGSDRKRNSRLLDYILKKHQGDRLIEALRDTEQQDIVNYLNENRGECASYLEPKYSLLYPKIFLGL